MVSGLQVQAQLQLWYRHIYRCDDIRDCVMQFWPPDDEHLCSKHVEAWNKLIVKQKFCASSWLITEINILRCTVSKTSKLQSLSNTHTCGIAVTMSSTAPKLVSRFQALRVSWLYFCILCGLYCSIWITIMWWTDLPSKESSNFVHDSVSWANKN